MPKLKNITLEDIDPERFIEIHTDDPEFWDKATHVVTSMTESMNEGYQEFEYKFRYFYNISEAYRRLDGGDGYVYILENSSLPGILKIGSTERTPGERLREINRGAGVIIPWRLASAFRCKAPRVLEKAVHAELDKVRVRGNKEGFATSQEEAEDVIRRLIKVNTEKFKLN